jgi:hypothetical protein
MDHARPRICILIPYFGRWPFWMPFFLESCRRNPDIDWLLFSDCGIPENLPENVRINAIRYEDYCALVARRLKIPFMPENPYKLCDIRPALGHIHADCLKNHDFWGWGDIDVVYGQLREYFTDQRLARYDLVSCHARRVSGHLALIRNTPRMCQAFRRIPDWRQRFSGSHQALDEGAFSRIFLWRKNFPEPLFKLVGLFNPWRRKSDFREAYSTPNAGLAWTNGSRNFPANWFWREGHLSNDKDIGREFPYFHFMSWKKQWLSPPSSPESMAALAAQPCWQISVEGFKVNHMRQGNPWQEKTQALDAYRWHLLRERHGVLGSMLRFIRNSIVDAGFGLCARFCTKQSIRATPCDFLLLQSAPKVIALRRKKRLIEALRHRGHTLTETALPDFGDILRQRLLKSPPHDVPLRYFGYAAHAEWVVSHHTPKILLNDRNGSLYAPFLRLSLQHHGGFLVQLAHATTVESSQRLSMNDYDYYFLFGQSSLDALKRRKLLFGASRAVLAGSHMIDDAYDLPPAQPGQGAVLILGVGPDKEKESGYQRTYALLRDWTAQHPKIQVRIKAHPRSQTPFWTSAAKTLDNLKVLPADCTLANALKTAYVVINIMSNAVIEAALAKRPIMVVNLSEDIDIFEQHRFFSSEIHSCEAITETLSHILASYPESLDATMNFAHFHLEQGVNGLRCNLEYLEAILNSRDIPFVLLSGQYT